MAKKKRGRSRGRKGKKKGGKKDRSLPAGASVGTALAIKHILLDATPTGISAMDQLDGGIRAKAGFIPIVKSVAGKMFDNTDATVLVDIGGGMLIDWLAPKKVHRSVRKLTRGRFS
jgi:hypothetical protein